MQTQNGAPAAIPVQVVQQVKQNVTGPFTVQQISIPIAQSATVRPVEILSETTERASFAIKVHPNSPASIELLHNNQKWGDGYPMAPGETVTLDNYIGDLYALADPSGTGQGDVRIIQLSADKTQNVKYSQLQ